MKLTEFNQSVRSAAAVLRELALMEESRVFRSLEVSDAFKTASLSGAPYEEVYLTALRERDYNFLLYDYSFMQFTHMGGRHGGVRYLYYPSPYEFLSFAEFIEQYPDTLAEDEAPHEAYAQFLSEQPIRFAAPAVRFEVDYDAYTEASHPAAHFHFGSHTGNRWAASFELSPLIFTLHIAKMFYGDAWLLFGEPGADGINRLDHALAKARRECEELRPEHFTDLEKAIPHFN